MSESADDLDVGIVDAGDDPDEADSSQPDDIAVPTDSDDVAQEQDVPDVPLEGEGQPCEVDGEPCPGALSCLEYESDGPICQLDSSGDGIPDAFDNCPDRFNPDQEDSSGDGVGDVCDNCPDHINPDQEDSSGDGVGDVCDNCPDHFNPDQEDSSGDGVGDVCDNCPDHFNPGQEDSSGNGIGDACACNWTETTTGVCADGRLDGEDLCQAPETFQDQESSCDGLDNDCNGLVDDVFVAISSGDSHSCAVDVEGRALCWGTNDYGQLGYDTGGNTQEIPGIVSGGHTFVEIAAGGRHTCGITVSGQAYCWGFNDRGQLGDGSTEGAMEPTAVFGAQRFEHLSVGHQHSCGLDEDQEIWCWGSNERGQLGNGNTADSPTPVRVIGNHSWVALAVGAGNWDGLGHSCGIAVSEIEENGEENGESEPALHYEVFCWGDNSQGQLGQGTTTEEPQSAPIGVPQEAPFFDVAAGSWHSCGLQVGGELVCWGRNDEGQLGDGSTTSWPQPQAVMTDRSFEAITAGEDHTCALDTTHRAYCWGNADFGKLGTSGEALEPGEVTGAFPFSMISAGARHTCAVGLDQQARCWGSNDAQQIGGAVPESSLPRAVICSCSEENLLCDGLCVTPSDDSNHCGGCGIQCAEGEECYDGVCGCETECCRDSDCGTFEFCNDSGVCDYDCNCGVVERCCQGNCCATTDRCCGSTCCPGTSTCCGGGCCPAGYTCQGGQCSLL